MPHVIVKLWPGNTAEQKAQLADAIAEDVCAILGKSDKSVSVSFEEIAQKEWAEKVYKPDIVDRPDLLVKQPGYSLGELP
jgi:4-oxalocrotonate tautomerase